MVIGDGVAIGIDGRGPLEDEIGPLGLSSVGWEDRFLVAAPAVATLTAPPTDA